MKVFLMHPFGYEALAINTPSPVNESWVVLLSGFAPVGTITAMDLDSGELLEWLRKFDASITALKEEPA